MHPYRPKTRPKNLRCDNPFNNFENHPFTKHGWTNLPVPASPISLLNTKVWRIWLNSPYKRIGKQTVRQVNWIVKLLHLNYYCLMMVEMFIRSQKGTLFSGNTAILSRVNTVKNYGSPRNIIFCQ
jgi:hypothetical protein